MEHWSYILGDLDWLPNVAGAQRPDYEWKALYFIEWGVFSARKRADEDSSQAKSISGEFREISQKILLSWFGKRPGGDRPFGSHAGLEPASTDIARRC